MMWRYRHHRVGTGPVLVHCGMLHYDVMTEERLTHYWSMWVESQIFELTNPTVNLSHTPQCTIKKINVHISVLNGALWDKGQVLYWICNLDFGMVCHWPLLGLLFPVIMPSLHYSDVTMNAMAYQITGVSNVCSIVYSGADLRNNKAPRHWSFVCGIHRCPVDSPHKGPVTRKSVHLMTSSCSQHIWRLMLDLQKSCGDLT